FALDCVAKVDEIELVERIAAKNFCDGSSVPSRLCEIEICNNRIGASVLLNPCCSFVSDLESMFHDQMPKILLQHNPLESGHQSARLPTPYACQPGLPFRWRTGRTVVVCQL